MEYSIELIQYLFAFTEAELEQIKNFLSELNNLRNQDKNFDEVKFLESVDKIVLKNRKTIKKLYYSDFIKNNFKAIENLKSAYKENKEANLLNKFLEISSNRKLSFGLCHLIDHIVTNYDKKAVMIYNLHKLQNLHLDTINYLYKPNSFDIEEKCGIQVTEYGKQDEENYMLSSFYTDGEKKWTRDEGIVEYEIGELRFQKDVKTCYTVYLENVSYVLYYTKSKYALSDVMIYLNRLDFDVNTLPKYEELYDNEVWQELGDSKTKAIDNIGLLVDSSTNISKMIEDISKLDMLSSEQYYKDTLKQMKELCKKINNLSVMTSNYYEKNNIITEKDYPDYIKTIKRQF